MKVLVTGAAGFLGSHIVQELIRLGNDVICLDVEQGYAIGRLKGLEKYARFVTADITQNSLQAAIGEQLDCVIHLAAIAAPSLCDQNPSLAFDINVNGTHNILKLALNHGVKRVILASSAHVYGISPKYLPTDERHPLWLQDCYTTTKILSEKLCQLFYDNHGLGYMIVRLFNGYGPGQPAGYFIPDMLKKAQAGHIELKGKDVTKDFVFVSDVASALRKAAESQYVGAINIGSGVEAPLGNVASYIAEKLGATISFAPQAGPGPTRMLCDRARAWRILGWQPEVSLEEGLDATINAAS